MSATTIFLETHYFGEDSEELSLPCEAVAATAGGLVVAGIEARRRRALKWLFFARFMREFRSMFQVLLGREPTEDERLDAMIRFDWTP